MKCCAAEELILSDIKLDKCQSKNRGNHVYYNDGLFYLKWMDVIGPDGELVETVWPVAL